MCNINLTRTAHAIGQGAFYSEQFKTLGNPDEKIFFRLIYDCGSKTLVEHSKKSRTGKISSVSKELKIKISNDLEKGDEKENDVDILVISHFHEDHINGIEFLNPKVIVIPLLNEEELIMLAVGSLIKGQVFVYDLEARLSALYPNSRIVKVKSMPEEGGERMADEQSYELSELTANVTEINSGSAVIINSTGDGEKMCKIWEYRFFNPTLSRFLEKFKNELTVRHLDFDKLKDEGSKEYIVANLKALTDAYKKIGQVNEHSLLMSSNSTDSVMLERVDIAQFYLPKFRCSFCYDECNYCDCYCHYHYRHRCDRYCGPGAFYWGDIEVSKKLSSTLKAYLDKRNPLSFIQIPHHGAYRNYMNLIVNGSIYNVSRPTYCVMQFGTDNTYGHPGAGVITKLLQQGMIPVLVTERADSCFIQSMRLFIKT